MKLPKSQKMSLNRNDKTTFVLRERPVGLLRYVQLYNDGKTAESNWFASYLVLSTPYNNKCYTLPCYRWLTSRSLLSLRDGTGKSLLTTYLYWLNPFCPVFQNEDSDEGIRRQARYPTAFIFLTFWHSGAQG